MLEVRNLHATIADKEILKGIDLTVKDGEIHALWDQMVLENQLLVQYLQVIRCTP